jgi:hypothetical protein
MRQKVRDLVTRHNRAVQVAITAGRDPDSQLRTNQAELAAAVKPMNRKDAAQFQRAYEVEMQAAAATEKFEARRPSPWPALLQKLKMVVGIAVVIAVLGGGIWLIYTKVSDSRAQSAAAVEAREALLTAIQDHFESSDVPEGWTAVNIEIVPGMGVEVSVEVPSRASLALKPRNPEQQLKAVGRACPTEESEIWEMLGPEDKLLYIAGTEVMSPTPVVDLGRLDCRDMLPDGRYAPPATEDEFNDMMSLEGPADWHNGTGYVTIR